MSGTATPLGITAVKTPKKGVLAAFLSFAVVFVIFIFGICLLLMQRYLKTYKYYTFHRGDVVGIRDTVKDFSTRLCSGYEVDPFLEADVYLIPHKAATDRVNRKIHLNNYTDLYSGTRYKYQAMHLFAGSKISARGCKKQISVSDNVLVGIFVFKGGDSWNEWKDNQRCKTCFVDSVTIQEDQFCDQGLSANLEYLVTDTATYYIAMARNDPLYVYKTTYFGVSVTLNRTILDVTKATQWCLRATNCSFLLEYDSDQDIVVDIPDNSILERDFGSHCHPRVMFWVGVFVIFPLSLIFVIVACCGCCYLADKREERHTVPQQIKVQSMYTVSDTARLVQNENVSPSYGEIVGSVQSS